MQPYSVFLVEGGFPAAMPGMLPETPSATFPFWGAYHILDFAAAAYREIAGGLTILADGRFRNLSARLPPELLDGADTLDSLAPGLEAGLGDLLGRLRAASAPRVLCAPVCQVFLAEAGALAEALRTPQSRQGIVRLAVGGCPTDVYLAERRELVATLKRALQGPPPAQGLSEWLFDGILGSAFETILDLPGTLWFRNTLMQLYAGNLWLAERYGTPAALQALRRLRPLAPGPQTVVERGGEVRRSFLAPGCRVEGYVEGSFLFPGVVVHKGAVVYNSVIMTGNRIGARAQLCRALLLPDGAERGAAAVNIGENASIGLKASAAVNQRHPQQIREGLTVLGMGVDIPRGQVVGPGCLVGAGVSPQTLKGRGEIRKGNSVPCSTDR